MAITLNDNLRINASKHIDDRYLDNLIPYVDAATAHTATAGRRYLGLTVNIAGNEFWYKSATNLVTDLVAKTSGTVWKGDWIQQQYVVNEQVLDSGYLAIANKTTTDRPAPQPTGESNFIYTPTIIPTTSISAKQIIFGNRYTFNKNVLLSAWRVYVIAGNSYSIYLIESPVPSSGAIISQIINYVAQRSGWIVLNVPQTIIRSGSTYDLVAAVSQSATAPTITSANFNYKKPTNPPSPNPAPNNGDFVQANSLKNTLYINVTDSDGLNQSSLLSTLGVGDIIIGDNTRWAIQSPPVNNTTYYTFIVSPATQLSSTGVKTFNFQVVSATPLTYPLDANYWGINPPAGITAQGLLAIDTSYFSITPNTTAYGTDLLIQDITVSPDWDIQAISESNGDGGSGSSGGVPSARILNINGDAFDLTADREWRTAQADTGIISWASGGLTLGTPNTTLNIGAVVGYIVNNETNPAIPTYTIVNYAGETNKVVPVGLSYILLNSSGVIEFQNTIPTSDERKTKIWLGKINRPATNITAISNEPDYILSPQALVRDLFQVLGPYINDNVYPSPNGANMNVTVSNGNILGDGINFATSRTNPNKLLVPATPIASLIYRTINGGATGVVTDVDAANYNPTGGTISAVPGGPNVSTIQYFWAVPTSTGIGFLIQYGQFTYGNLDAARAAVGKETNVVFPALPGNAILLAALAVRSGTTTGNGGLAELTNAQFYKADKLGQLSPTGGSIASGTGPTTIMFTFTINSAMSTSDTDTNGYGQDGRNVVLNNANNLNISCDGNVTASYAKHGGGTISFIQGVGRTLIADGVSVGSITFFGLPGSTAALWTVPGTTIDYLRTSTL